jgi:hypothetical protein
MPGDGQERFEALFHASMILVYPIVQVHIIPSFPMVSPMAVRVTLLQVCSEDLLNIRDKERIACFFAEEASGECSTDGKTKRYANAVVETV